MPEKLDSNDQKSFHEAGVPAVQLFLDLILPPSHRHSRKIDPEGLLKVASVAKEFFESLAGREEPMITTLEPGKNVEIIPKRERKVGLGTILDFAFGGDGYRHLPARS